MNALEAYRDVLRELDKYESPTFTVNDFNYFYNKAISQYIDSNYRQFDLLMKDVQDLSCFTASQTLTLPSSGEVSLPLADYRHLLSLKITVKFKVNIGRYKSGQSYEFWPERMKSGQKGFRYRSAYGKPNFRRYYYEIYSVVESGVPVNKVRILFDSSKVEFFGTNNLVVDYIKQPAAIALASNGLNPQTLEFNQSTTVRNNIYFEIINICRALFLENIESPRAPIAMQESAMQQ